MSSNSAESQRGLAEGWTTLTFHTPVTKLTYINACIQETHVISIILSFSIVAPFSLSFLLRAALVPTLPFFSLVHFTSFIEIFLSCAGVALISKHIPISLLLKIWATSFGTSTRGSYRSQPASVSTVHAYSTTPGSANRLPP